MYLTHSMLSAHDVKDDAADAILAAHQRSIEAMRNDWAEELTEAQQLREAANERDRLLEALDKLKQELEQAKAVQEEFDAYRAAQEEAALTAQKQSLLTDALLEAGANAEIVPLLMKEIDLDGVMVTDGRLEQAEDTIEALKEKWPGCFAAIQPVPVSGDRVQTSDELLLSPEDVQQMTHAEINANWPAVQQALRCW